MLRLALRLARRELRGGLGGFRIFLACLTLGVGAIAAVQSTRTGIIEGLQAEGRSLLGGDVSVRQLFLPATPEQEASFAALGNVASYMEMRAMARAADGNSVLVELKAVDDRYPLYGRFELADGGALQAALAERDGVWGAVAEQTVLDRLGLAVGDQIAVGDAALAITGVIAREPDRAGAGFSLGPRLMIATAAMPATGLVQPGSMINYEYLVRLAPGEPAEPAASAIAAAWPDQGWRVRDHTNASPSLERNINQLTLFLTLVGLTALVVGGVGISNAVRAYLDGKVATIATLKCLGAPARLIFATYLLQILALAVLGILLGLVIGAAAPFLISELIAGLLPVSAGAGPYPGALLLAAGFGLLTALAFSLWPLARARVVPPGRLFRDIVSRARGRPDLPFVAATALAGLALAALAILSAADRWLAAGFVAGSAATLGTFAGAAWLVMRGTRRLGRPRRPGLRLALANLNRPGAPTPQVVLSLGLGLTVLVAIALVQGNMDRQIRDQIPDRAPSFFFIDVQPDQAGPLAALLGEIPGTSELEQVPSLRGRIIAANGVPAEQALRDQGESWMIRGDRGVTYRAQPQADDQIVEGSWWPADYAGPPLISVYEDLAAAFGIGVGDRLTVNILGRDLEAEIANLRAIDWDSISINYTMIFSPVPLSAAPHTFLSTVRATEQAEPIVQRTVAGRFSNISMIAVRQALETVNGLIAQIGTAVRATAAVSLVAGTLVLAGAIAASHRRRVYDAVVLKVLGATRRDVLGSFMIEYGLLGVVTALIAAVVGAIAAWAVVTQLMELDWVLLPGAILWTLLLSTAITLLLGLVGTWRALGQKAAPLLRNP